MRGKLIVLDGVDASGKKTQTMRAVKKLGDEGLAVRHVSFPNYDMEYSAPAKLYLDGKFGGNAECVNPYAASVLYTVDRFCSYRLDWGPFLDNGGIVVADRYTTSNAIHQGIKFAYEERPSFFKWLYEFEFDKVGLPRPDLVLFLDMPPSIGIELMNKRYDGDESKKDIHEKDRKHLFDSYENALEACRFYGWTRIPCSNGKEPLSPDLIEEEIYKKIMDVLN